MVAMLLLGVALVFACAASDSHSAHDRKATQRSTTDVGTLTLDGLIQGLDQDQTRLQMTQCSTVLSTLARPMSEFAESTVEHSNDNPVQFIQALADSLRKLTNATISTTAVQQACPRRAAILFGDLFGDGYRYQPFMQLDITFMAILHFPELAGEIPRTMESLAKREYQRFGVCLGKLLSLSLPIVAVPLSSEQLHRIVNGFVASFLSSQDPHSMHPPALRKKYRKASQGHDSGLHNSSHGRLSSDNCISNVDSQVEPANRALELIAGSLANNSCWSEAMHLHGWDCLSRTAQGLSGISSSVEQLYRMIPRLQRSSHCPKKFIATMRRLNNQPKLVLDVLSNLLEDTSRLESMTFDAMADFYEDRLWHHGKRLGEIFQVTSEPAFYKYQRLEIDFNSLYWPQKIVALFFCGGAIFFVSLAPLLCLFCSAISGWPSAEEEIVVTPMDTNTWDQLPQLLRISYDFVGGRLPVGSEVALCVKHQQGVVGKSGPPLREQHPVEMQPWNSSKPRQLVVPDDWAWTEELDFDDNEHDSLLDSSQDTMSFDSSGITKDGETRQNLVLRLTDQLPRMHCALKVIRYILGCLLPFIGSGPRRWTLKVLTRQGDAWYRQESLDPDTEEGKDESKGVLPRVFMNHQRSQLPVADQPLPTTFTVEGVTSASVHIVPKQSGAECLDILCLVSALTQLLFGLMFLCLDCRFHLHRVLFNGELPRIWLGICHIMSSLLVIHKKTHAMWFVHNQPHRLHAASLASRNAKVQSKLRQLKWWMARLFQRSATPVPVLRQLPTCASFLQPPISWTFRTKHRLEVGDRVRVAALNGRGCGALCSVLDGRLLTSTPNTFGDLSVQLDGELEPQDVHMGDIDLIDESVRARRVPLWVDLFTWRLLQIGLACWFILSASLLAFRERMLDDEGFLILHLSQSWGFVLLVQATCLFLELMAWMVSYCFKCVT